MSEEKLKELELKVKDLEKVHVHYDYRLMELEFKFKHIDSEITKLRHDVTGSLSALTKAVNELKEEAIRRDARSKGVVVMSKVVSWFLSTASTIAVIAGFLYSINVIK